MSDFFKMLFGGSDSKQVSTSTPTDMTPQAFKDLQNPFATELTKLMTAGGGPQYEGPLVADMGANEGNLLTQLMGQTGSGTSRNGLIESTLAGNFLPGQAGANPFLDAAIAAAQRPTFQGLEEVLSRTLPGRFTAAGQFTGARGSSAFDRAAAIAARAASDTAGDIATKMSFAGYDAERQRQQEAIPLSRAEVDATITNLQAQGLPRMIQDLGIERGMALFQQRTQQLLEIMKLIGGVTSPTIANTQQAVGTSETQKGVIPGLFPNGLGGGSKATAAATGGG